MLVRVFATATCPSVRHEPVLCHNEESYSVMISSPVGSVALLVARRTNDRKVAGSRPTKVVCITISCFEGNNS